MREELRRKAAESQVSSITIERDTFREECARLKIKMLAEETRLRLEHDRGCERQPQCPGTHDRPHVSAVTDVNTGQPCTVNHLGIGSSVCLNIAHCMFTVPGSDMGNMTIRIKSVMMWHAKASAFPTVS